MTTSPPASPTPSGASPATSAATRSTTRSHKLPETDREVVVLRAIQQIPSQEVAALLGVTPGALKVRYCRALKKVRELLTESVFDDIEDE